MENLFLKKLQIKEGFSISVLNAPKNAADILGDIPSTIVLSYENKKNADAYFIFALTKAELNFHLKTIQNSITDQTVIWIFYPKAKTPLASDLNLMKSWNQLVELNLAPCSSAAVDKTWTGIRIKTIDSQKKSGLSNAEITNNAYGKHIDVVNKIVIPPADLKNALTANQQKTRLKRIQKVIAELSKLP